MCGEIVTAVVVGTGPRSRDSRSQPPSHQSPYVGRGSSPDTECLYRVPGPVSLRTETYNPSFGDRFS